MLFFIAVDNNGTAICTNRDMQSKLYRTLGQAKRVLREKAGGFGSIMELDLDLEETSRVERIYHQTSVR